MKKFLKYFIIIIILVGIGGYIFWQQYKKGFIKDTISDSIIKNTDSLYTINYDSSSIDEINGNASFYDLQIQPDSAIKELFKSRNDLPNALYNIKVKEIQVVGVDVAGLLKKENLTAKKIVLNQPSIQITNTGADKPKEFTYKDTLQLYQQILGQFKTINTGAIQIINGSVLITDNKGKSLTTLENINVELKNFLVDSTRNYQNVISYFIKDVKITVENIQLPESKNDTRINMVGIEYDAAKRILYVKEIQQYKSDAIQPLTDLKNIQINQLNTDAFILYHELKAGMITCDGGIVTIYKNSRLDKTKKNNSIIQFSSNIIDEAKIEGVNLGNTKVIISNPFRPGDEPFIINDVKFTATKVASVTEASTVAQMINTADWELSASNFSLVTKDKLYKIIANNILINNLKSYVEVKNIVIKPLFTEAAFVKISRHQRDRFDLNFNNIILRQVNFKKLIIDNSLEIENVSLQPVMKIFNDRTLPPDPNSKVGKYPHQLLLKMDLPIYIKTLQVKDGNIAYKEKAAKSKLTGNVFFTHLNATINNLTNINQKIQSNAFCNLNASALFLGKAKLSTTWRLPLSVGNKSFTATGTVQQMNATVLNQIIEPLAMASVKEGKINKLDFNLSGNDYKGTGDVLFLYNDLNIEILKKGKDNELKTRDLISFFANKLVKNENPRGDETYTGKVDFERDIYKSFFNLLWKSLFDGVKKTVLGKKINK